MSAKSSYFKLTFAKTKFIKLIARSFQFIFQTTLFQLQFFIQYHKFLIKVRPNLYCTE